MANFEEEDRMRSDPNNWKWGFLYYNPKDGRLLVPKRMPYFGITVNFANPKALLLLLPILCVIVLAFCFIK